MLPSSTVRFQYESGRLSAGVGAIFSVRIRAVAVTGTGSANEVPAIVPAGTTTSVPTSLAPGSTWVTVTVVSTSMFLMTVRTYRGSGCTSKRATWSAKS